MSATARRNASDGQRVVDAFFDRDAANWQAIYERPDVFSVIHQYRRRTALEWTATLGLGAGTRVLEIGCGAGLVAVALAQHGFDVVAADSAPAMLEMTLRNATDAGVRVAVRQADAHHLEDPSGHYGLVLALGVIPWLHSPEQAIAELARVIRPQGYIVVNADNKARLSHLVDPLLTPVLAPYRRLLRRALGRRRHEGSPLTPEPVMHWRSEFDALLKRYGLHTVRAQTFGFGPFTMFGRRVLSERRSVLLHRRLQRLADRRTPLLRSTGAQYMVLARKAGDEPTTG